MNYVIRCSKPLPGENPTPRASSLTVWSKVEGREIMTRARPESVLDFLANEAAKRERSSRTKEIAKLARLVAGNEPLNMRLAQDVASTLP
jgi:hypothetical protein